MTTTAMEEASDLARRRVRLLSPELCNQIAAGEVIEHPASAVKELVENALDAGARSVLVDLGEGGRGLIRVTDDGAGMDPEDAELSLQRHATSKIATVEDLTTIRTLGFRGEALASIASVSRLTLTTQPHGALVGTRIRVEGGRVVEVSEAGSAPGTRIEVHDLFYNTPARLKFQKRVPTELRRVQVALTRLSLVWFGVRFRLTHEGRKRFDVAPHGSFGDRLLAVLGRETWDHLYAVPQLADVGGVTVSGYFGAPGAALRSTGSQYTFVNGRYVQDRTINAAVQAAYRELLPRGRAPVVGLLLEMPPELVDVNVHPTKIEVRFQDTDTVFRAVFRSLREGLARSPWAGEATSRLWIPRQELPGDDGDLVDTDKDTDAGDGDPAPGSGPRSRTLPGVYATADDPAWVRTLFGQGATNSTLPPIGRFSVAGLERPLGAGGPATSPTATGPDYFSRLRYIGQYARTYLLASDGFGLVVIDQHAAHERISFERLKAAWVDHRPESQQLLFPVQLELDALRAAALEEQLELFATVGFDIEPFGGPSFAIKAVPGILAGARYEQVVRDALDELSHTDRTTRFEEAVEAVLSRMACHGSVRAGDDLTADEAYALFAQMDRIDFSAQCPHGRPVSFRLSLEELEKRFERT